MKLRNLLFGVLAALSVGAFAADPPPASSTSVIITQNLVPGGACTAGGCAELTTQGQGTVTVQTVGTYTGVLSGQVTTDGTTWITLGSATTFTRGTTGATSATIGSGVQDTFTVTVAGYKRFRITALAAVTGSVTVSLQGAPGGGGGGSSGGGGGASTIADGADVAEGSTTDAASAAGGTGTISSKLRLQTSQLDQLHTDLIASNIQLPTTIGQTTAAGSLSVVQASDATPTVAQASTTSGQKGNLTQCATTTSAPTYVTGQTNPCSTDTAGNLRVTTTFGSTGTDVTVALTRTNDTVAYTANDIVGTSVGATAALTFTALCPLASKPIMITSAELRIDAAAVISGETGYLLYLYNVTPPSASVDNAAWDLPSGDRASFLGAIALGTPVDLGSTLYVASDGINKQILCPASQNIFAYLVTIGGYTPTALRVYNITLHAVGL